MNILTQASNTYMNAFYGYISQFMAWGEWLFYGLVVIHIVWLCLWHAFDRHSFSESTPDFIKKFFVITFFYTLMIHPEWLISVLQTAQWMGGTLTQTPIDPSSLLSAGIALANKIIQPVQQSSLLTIGFSLIILSIVYVIILFVFISIALDLALTLIMTTALISVASFFLSFAALGATTQIARQTLDIILSNCVKLLGIYLVVAAGSQTLNTIAAAIPINADQLKAGGLDPYAWIVAASILFWLIAKNLPHQLSRIVAGALHETHGTDAAALALASLKYAGISLFTLKLLSNSIEKGKNALGNLTEQRFNSSNIDSASSSISSSEQNISDRFKNLSERLVNNKKNDIKNKDE